MIYPYVGDFLLSPIPLQLSFNFCSHKCSYCFANLNNPNRSFDLKDFQSQLKGMFSNNSLTSVLLRHRYPILISNLVDPFAISNYATSVPILEMFSQYEIPVSLQTRGGRGIEEVLNFLSPSVWYISIPMLNDEIRKVIEPAAPTIQSRLQLINTLVSKGHKVVVGLNPTFQDWLPGEDGKLLIDQVSQLGASGIWVNPLHFNTRQVSRMPQKDRERLGEQTIQRGLKNARKLDENCSSFITDLTNYALSKGIEVEGLFACHKNNFFDPYYETYGQQTFPTIYKFINWCYTNKQDNDPVYYHEFETIMLEGLPHGKFNISPYMRCMSAKLDEEVRKSDGYKQSFQYLLNLCWNDHRMKRMMNRFWTFAFSCYEENGESHYLKDNNGNLIFHFSRSEFPSDYYFPTN